MKRTILAVSIIFVVAACKTNPKTKTSFNTAQTHAGQMEAMFPKAKADIKTVGILLYDNYSIIDAMGPFQVFSDLMNAKVFLLDGTEE